MATLTNPVNWNGATLTPGPWEKPHDMPFSSVISLYAIGLLESPSPEDLGSSSNPSPEEWAMTLKEYKSLYGPKPCPSCVGKV